MSNCWLAALDCALLCRLPCVCGVAAPLLLSDVIMSVARCMRKPSMRPEENTNAPGPRSIRPVPYVSAFAKRRGKIRKSTAKMAVQVYVTWAARNSVTYLQPKKVKYQKQKERKKHRTNKTLVGSSHTQGPCLLLQLFFRTACTAMSS